MPSPKKNAPAEAETPPQIEPDLSDDLPNTTVAVEAIVEPAMEMQETVRHVLEQGVVDTRAAFVRAKVSAEDAANAFELSFTAITDGVIAINTKALDVVRANAEANFDFVKASFAVRSIPDLVALQKDFARERTDAVVAQLKDLTDLAQKAVVETFEPIKDQLTKSFKLAA
jgi:phasin family protein